MPRLFQFPRTCTRKESICNLDSIINRVDQANKEVADFIIDEDSEDLQVNDSHVTTRTSRTTTDSHSPPLDDDQQAAQSNWIMDRSNNVTNDSIIEDDLRLLDFESLACLLDLDKEIS